uniref:Amidase domain-containing protein n=1 Tax=Plectus sambesii TaxID=2011161 RepID=A0A914X9C4_9BILA
MFTDGFLALLYNEDDSRVWALVKCCNAAFWLVAVCYWTFKPWGLVNIHREVVKNKRKLRQKQFDSMTAELNSNVDSTLSKKRETILAMSFTDLRNALQKEDYSASEALDAYRFKALQVQMEINCVTEFVVEAVQWASDLDAKYKGKSKPALFGIPFSVKENYYMKGYDCTVGLAKRSMQPMTSDNSFVAFLRSQGGVPFVRTNVPQALISFVCSNTVYGTTGNPFNKERTPGGSSGGEAALLAADGSAFGIGSDLAGSLRIPAAMCGIVTIKPTAARLRAEGAATGMPGRGRLGLGYGFFTKTVDEQIFLLETTLTPDYFDRSLGMAPLPLMKKEIESKSKLRIGYFTDDGFLPATPGCARVVTETVRKLEDAGHVLIPFNVPQPEAALKLLLKCLFPDGGQFLRDSYAHEDVDQHLKQFVTMLKVPNVIRKMMSYLLLPLCRQMGIMSGAYVSDLNDLRLTQEAVDAYIFEFGAQWKELELDALVCPAFAIPPVPHHYPSQLGACAFSTGLFNLLDYPAGVVPVGHVTDEDDAALQSFPEGFNGTNLLYALIKKAAAKSRGLPLAVQIVTLPFREELCLRLMKEVETLTK